MLATISKLPLRIARKVFRTVFPKSEGGVSDTPVSGGFKRPPEAVRAAPEPDEGAEDMGHDHGHHHGHDHGHSHGHAEAEAPPPAAPKVYAEETPNPNAMKFTVDRKVVDKGSVSFNSAAEAQGNALGAALFAVAGVKSIFAVKDFVTVTKEESARWSSLEPALIRAIQSAL